MSIGAMHAVALRDTLRTGVAGDPGELALAFGEATETDLAPWYQSTLQYDRHRLAEIDVLRASVSVASLIKPGDEVLSDPMVTERAMELGAEWREGGLPGPDREQLLAIING